MTEPAVDLSARFAADPERPGWLLWRPSGLDRYGDMFNPLWVRVEAEGRLVRCRIEPRDAFSNTRDNLHGGFLMGFVDQVLFIGSLALGVRRSQAVTLDTSAQFLSAGNLTSPLDAVVEVVHRTGKMLFIRGLMEQDGRNILAFSGTLREIAAPILS